MDAVELLLRLAAVTWLLQVAPSVNDQHGHAVLRLSLGVLLHTMVERMHGAAAAELKALASGSQGISGGGAWGSSAQRAGNGNGTVSGAAPRTPSLGLAAQPAGLAGGAASATTGATGATPRMFLYSGHDR
jgi:hypothetical protein